MNSVLLKKVLDPDRLPFPSPQITYDAQGRFSQLRYDFTSFRVDYDITWVGLTNVLDTYTQTVSDLP